MQLTLYWCSLCRAIKASEADTAPLCCDLEMRRMLLTDASITPVRAETWPL